MIEHSIDSQLMHFVESTKLFRDQQNGFWRNRSCETQLIELLSDLSKKLDDGHEMDAYILHFAQITSSVCTGSNTVHVVH